MRRYAVTIAAGLFAAMVASLIWGGVATLVTPPDPLLIWGLVGSLLAIGATTTFMAGRGAASGGQRLAAMGTCAALFVLLACYAAFALYGLRESS
jgi:hypothetical protein